MSAFSVMGKQIGIRQLNPLLPRTSIASERSGSIGALADLKVAGMKNHFIDATANAIPAAQLRQVFIAVVLANQIIQYRR